MKLDPDPNSFGPAWECGWREIAIMLALILLCAWFFWTSDDSHVLGTQGWASGEYFDQ